MLSVPYFSQIHDVTDSLWQRRSCSVVNLKMALDFLSPVNVPSIKQLIEEGVAIGAYDEKVGWSQDGIVRLARNHGVVAYTQEFRSVVVDPLTHAMTETDALMAAGLAKLRAALQGDKPVIVSVFPGFSENKTIHTITLIGADETGFFYHDPITERREDGESQFITTEDFLKSWRRFAIFFD